MNATALSIVLAVTLSACGNKGPLVLAEAPAAEAPETPAGEVPVELTPEAAANADLTTTPSVETLDDAGAEDADAPPVGSDPAEPPAPIPGRG